MAQSNRTHEYRIGSLERMLDHHDSILDEIGQRVSKLEYWRDGNGSRGVEERVQDVENTMITEARANELINRSSRETAEHVIDTLAKQGNHRFRDVMQLLIGVGAIGGLVLSLVQIL